MAAVDELSVVPVTEEQGAQRRARAFALRDSADDELGAPRRLDLEPGLGALAGFVLAVLALGDHALEAARERRLVELFPVFLGVHQLDVGRGKQALLEPAPAVRVGRSAHVEAREVQQVEAEDDDRRRAVGGCDLALCFQLHALLEGGEGRSAVGAESGDFAVEQHAFHRLLRQLGNELGEGGGEVEAAPRAQLHFLVVDENENAVAVELGLPHPAGAGEGGFARFREHGKELHRQNFLFSGGDELRRGDAAHRQGLEALDHKAGEDRVILPGDVGFGDEAILVLDEQPVLRVPRRADQRERAFEFGAAKRDAQLAGGDALPDEALGVRAVVVPMSLAILVGCIRPAVPHDHLARAVLLGGNHALEGGVIVGMVLGHDREALVRRVERRAAGHGPGLEHAVALQPEVVVQLARRVLLDHEKERSLARSGCGRRLGRRVEGALLGIFVQQHCRRRRVGQHEALGFRHARDSSLPDRSRVLDNPVHDAAPRRNERLFLQGVARQVLPRKASCGRDAALLCRTFRDGRDQQHFLPHAGRDDARALGRRSPRKFRLHP